MMKTKLMGALALLCLSTPALAGKPTGPKPPEAKPAQPAETKPAETKAAEGPTAAGATVLTLDDKKVPFAGFMRKVTVLQLFSSQFSNLEKLKRLEALHQRFKDDKDVAFVAVAIDVVKSPDDLAVLKELTQPLGLTMPVVVDQGFTLLGVGNGVDYGGKLPGSARMVDVLVLDRAGRVIDKGGIPMDMPVEQFVKETAPDIEAAKAKSR